MARCDMHGASSGIHRDEAGGEDWDFAVEKGMSRFDLLKLRSWK